jgi:hypothetical protein
MHRIFGQTVYERLDRITRRSVIKNRVGAFLYWVDGPHVFREAADGSIDEVVSDMETQESLTPYQLAQLRQNRRPVKLRIV